MQITIRKITIALVALTIVCCVGLSGCRKGSDQDAGLADLDRRANLAMSSLGKEGLDSLANLLLQEATKAGNRHYQGKAHFYLSSFNDIVVSKEVAAERLAHLDEAEAIAREISNDTLLAYVYNQRGVLEFGQYYSPITAQYWFNRSIETARPLGKRRISIPAEINMSEASRLIGDTVDIAIDENLYRYARERNDTATIFATAFHCALYYATQKADSARLAGYLDDIRNIHVYGHDIEKMLMARYYLTKNEIDKAAAEIQQATPGRFADLVIVHAEILNRQGKYADSEKELRKMPHGNTAYQNNQGKILELHADNAAGLNRWRDAYDYRTQYNTFTDSLKSIRALDLTKKYKVEYEVNLKDREIAEQRLRIRNLATAIIMGTMMVIIIIAGGILYHRHKMRFYRKIVRQNMESIEREKRLEEQIETRDRRISELEEISAPGNIPESEAEPKPEAASASPGKLSDATNDRIFAKISKLSDEQQIWRDVNITRETFADLVGCNRTYFSEVIKKRTGMSYTQYMNSCRIQEAIRILSDPSDDTPLKDLSTALGFLSLGTFYSSFKQATGISPAAYRKTARELQKSQSK